MMSKLAEAFAYVVISAAYGVGIYLFAVLMFSLEAVR